MQAKIRLPSGVQGDAETAVDFVEQQENRLVLDHPLRLGELGDFAGFTGFLVGFRDLERKTGDVAGVSGVAGVPDDELEAQVLGELRDPFGLADAVGALEHDGLAGRNVLDCVGELLDVHWIPLRFLVVERSKPFAYVIKYRNP